MKYYIGDVIRVQVGTRTFETIIDDYGVQRFRENGVLRVVCDRWYRDWDDYTSHDCPEPMGLNMLARMYYQEMFSQDDYLTFCTMLGYSVCGLAELSFFQDLEITNPLWDDQEHLFVPRKRDETPDLKQKCNSRSQSEIGGAGADCTHPDHLVQEL